MLATPLKLYRLDKASFTGSVLTTPGRAEEYIAYQSGLTTTDFLVREAMVDMGEREDVEYCPGFSLLCPDGLSIESMTRETLRRTFHAIDDFCEAYPDETSYPIPYTARQVKSALRGLNWGEKLVDCIDCIKHLHPKSWTYFLRYDLTDVTERDLIEIASMLTKEERIDILRARRLYSPDYSLPDEGMDHCILAAVLERTGDYKTAIRLFSSYPSFLVAMMSPKRTDVDELTSLLLTADFSQREEGVIPTDGRTAQRIQEIILWLLESTDRTWEEMIHLLSMVGYGHRFVDSVEKVAAPFRLDKFEHIRKTISSTGPGVRSIASRLSKKSPTPLTEHEALVKLGALFPQTGGN